jgi:hypothetical protein
MVIHAALKLKSIKGIKEAIGKSKHIATPISRILNWIYSSPLVSDERIRVRFTTIINTTVI